MPESSPRPTAPQLRYLEAGLQILARDGYPSLKLAAVCDETSTTTGSFYYAFPNWASYCQQLIDYWRHTKSEVLIESVKSIDDPRERIDALLDVALNLPYESEAAIRIWSASDPDVARAVAEADAARVEVIADSYTALIGDAERGEHLARLAMMLLVGHELGTTSTFEELSWSFHSLLDWALGPGPDTPPR
ncbi:putative TetR family transcriptional regulator [Gordonia effusa NBRC 100432]|uniref:Putative TetR family transcriptional regulator n=1 Tax=Gordonia effusa NBRC 100432 TaxID=1077974 RepID=H0QV92_9ACTN|nr:TetR/AcrR family transcriptional regulator [Gordonia effusa]GAB16743.1 putative TetR family transcriptional regulator [Gordonia effusa NBRC 100432]